MEKVLVGVFKGHRNNPINEARLAERVGLVGLLNNEGIPNLEVNCVWPRDYFTRFDGRVYTSREHGNYADGGYVLTPRGITLAGAEVSLTDEGRIHNSVERSRKLNGLYGTSVRVLPSPLESWNESVSPHLDLVLFPLVDQKTLFVDLRYYQEFQKEVESLSESMGWKIRLASQDWRNPTYPCNSLLLDNKKIGRGKGQVALVVKEKNDDFIRSLKDLGIEVLATPFIRNTMLGGGINCATNTLDEDSLRFVKRYLS